VCPDGQRLDIGFMDVNRLIDIMPGIINDYGDGHYTILSDYCDMPSSAGPGMLSPKGKVKPIL
jgi:hypothetical protein